MLLAVLCGSLLRCYAAVLTVHVVYLLHAPHCTHPLPAVVRLAAMHPLYAQPRCLIQLPSPLSVECGLPQIVSSCMQEGDFSNPFADADRLEQQKRKADQQSQQAHAALTAAPAQQQQQQGQAQAAPTSAPQLGFGQSAPASSATSKHIAPVQALLTPCKLCIFSLQPSFALLCSYGSHLWRGGVALHTTAKLYWLQ